MPPQDQKNTLGQQEQYVEEPTMHNPLSVMQPGEKTLFELKRHPIGIFLVYFATGVVLIAAVFIAFAVVPGAAADTNTSQSTALSGLVFTIFTFLCVIFNLVATIVYWGNKWILTDDSITQISQTSLFHKESSQLPLESLEDVTSEKRGILPQIFDYGVLKAETAGHRSKFVFQYCPRPNFYAQRILQAHENLEQKQKEEARAPAPAAAQAASAPPTNFSSDPADHGINSNYQQ